MCNQGFHIIDDFLNQEHFNALLTKVRTMHQQDLFRAARIGSQEQAQLNNTIRTDKLCWLDEHTAEPAVQAYIDEAMQIATLFNQQLYLGLTEFETHFAVYQPGTFYKKHIDQFATKKTRKISCVYYLNEAWHHDFGGELRLYTKENQFIQSVQPQGNRFICFNSELPHEVCKTNQTRYSIAGWMKTSAT